MTNRDGDLNDSVQSLIFKVKDAQRRSATTNEDVEEVEGIASRNAVQEGKTRHTLTKLFLLGFFGLIVICFIFVLVYNQLTIKWIIELHRIGLDEQAGSVKMLDIEKVLAVVIGALGSSLGFIIGYYYKEKHG